MKENIKDIIKKEHSNILGIVAYKDNKKVYEEYYNDSYKEESIHNFSITKSVISLLIGIAIDKGYIKSVHQKVLEFFPNYKLKRNQEQLNEITIENFLTMSVPYKFKYEPYKKVFTSFNWGETVLGLIGGKKAIGEFHYSTVGIQVLSNILVIATKMSVKEFAQKYLFDLLDIKNLSNIEIPGAEDQAKFYHSRNIRGWVQDDMGYHVAGWGLSITADEYAKIGLLCLNKGIYNKKRMVSENYIKEMFVERQENYGYLWWIYKKNNQVEIMKKIANTGKYDSYAACGVGGSLIHIIPEKQIVISITCSLVYRPNLRFDLINKNLIPLIDKPL
ncbi:CubicO group peptidase (beta-lactamase class C family) [Breznakia sp. PF5-3]|uniref:serine hydrolase domain-containing protein n=1 Tax=unclassified Breznakia TaxID=2623764 RepID=UPI002406198C|nr:MULTISPECIES: serine hydrolase [unclassified Breznakia]MDL2276732.1 serine hydrolase [Breznakia sp. OttesenSCG-928-G09]MDF9825809.1 CubicO group peptidase (beta-lactamase class C family) [Breznakia sp. PM6-1]MDF9836614.1 CubicO group peptidase (beta-lactamase class C family) [Breznakia sp. PF5-3]MDF9838863.1 CubicO group peptidase (beta-lactamase class C family) [Breznakia sp. PFB2-8]MDF9860889.1 CubicO group peptidase (beta-lactamase class C family) [Breznakia sp. PH5-24]